MNVRKNALGRGLGALISEGSDPMVAKEIVQAVEATNEIELSKIEVNPFQPRQDFAQDELEELATSIKTLGVIQPITLRKLSENKYQLISGERRFRASKLAGLDRIPAYVRTADDQGMLEMALVENIHRSDLNAMEVAFSLKRLMDECSLTQESLSDRVGKKRATVANYLRLLKLPAQIQLGLRNEQVSMGHARTLVAIDNEEQQLSIFDRIVTETLSVREVEELVRRINDPEPVQQPEIEPQIINETAASTQQVNNDENADKAIKTNEPLPKEYESLKNHLNRYFKSNIEFKRTPKGDGKIIINFKNDEELERIIALLDSKNE